jgi:hypothetical protein
LHFLYLKTLVFLLTNGTSTDGPVTSALPSPILKDCVILKQQSVAIKIKMRFEIIVLEA